jgi:2-oxoglutarate dehydrogenase E2 component (dihydrolipoamide succinyltransferase)
MSIEIKVPALPESVSDATLVAWHKSVGESVSRDENLVDLETDKVVLEVPAPASGVIQEIKVADGTTVTAGEILAVLAEGDAAETAAPETEATASNEPQVVVEDAVPKTIKTSPAVRRLLDEHDLDATMVTGTGKDGRVTKADVMQFLKGDQSSNVCRSGTQGAARTDDSLACTYRGAHGRGTTHGSYVDDVQRGRPDRSDGDAQALS